MTLAENLLAGTGVLIAVYLIITNPVADATILTSGTAAYTGGVRALQGR